ncbi:MAG: nucleotidyltransferase family protein [Ruminococcus sp.]|nr:nucleotidyltransferase family protein [Ruminococcus sp.]
MDKNVRDLIYLLKCAVDSETPDKDKVSAMDLEALYKLSRKHSLSAAAATALSSAGIEDLKFVQAYTQAIRKQVMLDAECRRIIGEFEKRGIWYMPLKGYLLKNLYPAAGIREMADIDILFDKEKHDELREMMIADGYTPENKEKNHHDAFMKPPVMNFEMHTDLFSHHANEKLLGYYKDFGRFLIKNEDGGYGRHFSDNDFYVYITAHEYNHFNASGIGIRPFMDSYVFMREKGKGLDWDYIAKQLELTGMTKHEKQRREIADKLFTSYGEAELTPEEEEFFERFISSGTYGNTHSRVRNAIDKLDTDGKKHSKFYYLRRRLFPDLDHMRKHFPQFFRHKATIPFAYVFRIYRAVFRKRGRIGVELEEINKKVK